MLKSEQLAIIAAGVPAWNRWRKNNPKVRPLLRETEHRHACFEQINLAQANLRRVLFSDCSLRQANLKGADLSHARLRGLDLRGAQLQRANLSGADLTGSDLTGADLSRSVLVETKLNEANLSACRVYGVSAWDVRLEKTIQTNLVITPLLKGTPTIQADDLRLAQFLHLLLTNPTLRTIIDTITSKVVLILGRFTPARKAILDALRNELRERNYIPVLFDFDKPLNRDITETIRTLAHMAKFVIADITDARSIPHELMTVVPHLPSLPVQPILLASQREYGMFEHFRRFPWVLPTYLYEDEQHLLSALQQDVIEPAEVKAREQTQQGREPPSR